MAGEAERIGFVGLGNMGAPMSTNISKAGFDLTVYDVDAGKAAAHAKAIGARAAGSLAELGAASDIVVAMLPTSHVVQEVLAGQDGALLAHLRPGALVIDMSSSDPVATRGLGPLLSGKGIGFVDAPVSGAVPRATTGTLAIMVGSDDPAVAERARPVLSAMGDRIFATGKLGTGHAMKALNNYVAAAGFAAASEALILAERFGLDPAVALDIMNVSTGRNFSTESTIKSQVLTGDFASGFALALLAKDVRIAADLARALGSELPLVESTSNWWAQAGQAIGGDNDHTAAFKAWSDATA